MLNKDWVVTCRFRFVMIFSLFANFNADMIKMVGQDKKPSITNPRYLMLQDCSRYWSAKPFINGMQFRIYSL